MPSTSPRQARLMRAVANSPSFARKVNIPQSVGQEYAAADAGLLKNFRLKKPKISKIVPQMRAGYP